MRQEYVTEYAKDEFIGYENKISGEEKSIEDCLNETIRELKMRIGLHNSNWFSFQVRNALIDIGRMSIYKYPDKKDKIIQLIKDALEPLDYRVDDKVFNQNIGDYDR